MPLAAEGGGGGGSSAGPDSRTVLDRGADAGPDFRTVLDTGADVSGVQTANSEELDTTRRFYSGRLRSSLPSSNGGGGVGAGARAADHLSGVSEIIAAYGKGNNINAFIAELRTDNHDEVDRALNLPSLDGNQVRVESESVQRMVDLDELVGPTDPDDPDSGTFAFINAPRESPREFAIFNAEEFAVLGIWIENIDDFALADDYTDEFALIHFGVNPGSIPVGAANARYTSNSIQGYYTDSTGRYLITSATMLLTATFNARTPMFSGNIEITGGGAPLPFPFPLPLDNEDGTVTLELISGDIVDLPDAEDTSVTFSGMVNVQTSHRPLLDHS